VLATNAFIVFVVPLAWHWAAVCVQLGAALALVLALRPRLGRTVPPIAAAVPLAFHVFFVVAGLISGAVLRPPTLLAVSALALGLCLWLHAGTWLAVASGARAAGPRGRAGDRRATSAGPSR
jgi:hypothetical protein